MAHDSPPGRLYSWEKEQRPSSRRHKIRELTDAGMAVLLAGRSVRLPEATVAEVQQVLDRVGLSARIAEVPATLDETLITLARATAGSDSAADR